MPVSSSFELRSNKFKLVLASQHSRSAGGAYFVTPPATEERAAKRACGKLGSQAGQRDAVELLLKVRG